MTPEAANPDVRRRADADLGVRQRTDEHAPADAPESAGARAFDPARFSALRRLATDPRKRFVVSLGGGGVPSLCGNTALVALIEALGLREHVEEVWGTSAGAIVGGSWASGMRSPQMMEVLHSLQPHGVTDIDWLPVVKGLLLRPFGATLPDAILRGKLSYTGMVKGLAVRTFEECEIPFRCIACADDPSGRRKVFREGPLAPAISASMSLPGILLPRDEQGRPCHGFLDGGLIEKTPLYSPLADHVRLGDGRELLVLGTYFGVQTNNNAIAHGFIDRFLVTIDSLADHLWKHQEEQARGQPGVTVLLVNARIHQGAAHFDLSHVDENCLQAREAFEDQVQNAKLALTLGRSCAPRSPCCGP
jgi:predicted acylesterase/phospholipase RssA